jgi:hypothetical protein
VSFFLNGTVKLDTRPRDLKIPAFFLQRQYYRRARELHPDKNPDDPEAQSRFQKLGQAYQILSNPDQRAHYDATGDVDAAAEDDLVDSSLFFTMLFGSDKFDHIVGQLAMAAAASMGEQASERLYARAQLYRLIALAHGLRQRLDAARLGRVPDAPRAPQPLVPLALNEDEFVARAREEAKLLAAASFGPRMLMAVGRAYRTGARVAAGGLGGLAARVAGSAHSLRLQAGAVSSIFGVANAQHRAQRRLHAETQAERRRRDGRRFDQEFQTQETGKEDGNYVVVTKRSEDGEGGEGGENGTAAAAGGAGATIPEVGPQASTAEASREAAGTKGKAEKPDTGNDASATHGHTEGGEADEGRTVDSDEEDEEFARQMERELEHEALPHMLKAMWAANEIDVAQTLRQVSAEHGKGVGRQTRHADVQIARACCCNASFLSLDTLFIMLRLLFFALPGHSLGCGGRLTWPRQSDQRGAKSTRPAPCPLEPDLHGDCG